MPTLPTTADPADVILRGAATWNAWRRQANPYLYFSSPRWYDCPGPNGVQIKGANRLDFSGMDLSGAQIHRAFAEGLNLRGARFVGAHFEEGDFSRADFSGATFRDTRFNKTILTDACFDGASFVNCNLNRVNLTRASFRVEEITETVVYGIAAWDLQVDERSKQSRLVVERTYELYSDFIASGRVPLMVDDIELAQFVHYLANHKRVRSMIDVLTDRGVLLLGRFADGGLDLLYELRDALLARGYRPMIFDFARPDSLSMTETVVTMAALSKLIVVDLSGPSVPWELGNALSQLPRPVIAFGPRFAMAGDLKDKTRHLITIEGDRPRWVPRVLAALPKAEKMYSARVRELAQRYAPG